MASDTRERILEAAADLFWRQGYEATSLADIGKVAESGSGSIYYFFKTKEDLLVGVLERYRGLLRPMIVDPAFASENDPIERAFAIIDFYRTFLLEYEFKLGCPIAGLALEVADESASARALIAENFTLLLGAFQETLEAAGDRLPTWVERRELAQLMLSTLEGAIMQARAHRDIEPFDAAVRQLRTYVEQLEQGAPALRRE